MPATMSTCIAKESLLTSVMLSCMTRELTGAVCKYIPPFGTRVSEIGRSGFNVSRSIGRADTVGPSPRHMVVTSPLVHFRHYHRAHVDVMANSCIRFHFLW
jgi:hypothetical protein